MTAKTHDINTSKYAHGKIGEDLSKMVRQSVQEKKDRLHAEYLSNVDKWMMDWEPVHLRKRLEKYANAGETFYEFDVVSCGATPEETREYVFGKLGELKFGVLGVTAKEHRRPIHTVRVFWD